MNNLLRLIGNRLLWLPIMVFGVTVLVFFLMSLSPIDPAFSALGENASPDQLEAYRVEHGLNDPLIVRYGDYMVGFFHGDLGTFGPSNQSVSARIATALPITLQLGFFGFIIAIVASAILGVVSALYRDRWPDQVIRIFSIACIATPSFWLSVLFILLFSSTLHLLPASGALPALTQDPGGWLARMAMPGIALAVPLTGQMTRIIRTSMVEELDKDYVRHRPRLRHPLWHRRRPQRAAQRPDHARHRAWPEVRLHDRRRRGPRGHLRPFPGMGMAIVSGVTSNYVMLVQGADLRRRRHHVHHRERHRRHALHPYRSAN